MELALSTGMHTNIDTPVLDREPVVVDRRARAL